MPLEDEISEETSVQTAPSADQELPTDTEITEAETYLRENLPAMSQSLFSRLQLFRRKIIRDGFESLSDASNVFRIMYLHEKAFWFDNLPPTQKSNILYTNQSSAFIIALANFLMKHVAEKAYTDPQTSAANKALARYTLIIIHAIQDGMNIAVLFTMLSAFIASMIINEEALSKNKEVEASNIDWSVLTVSVTLGAIIFGHTSGIVLKKIAHDIGERLRLPQGVNNTVNALHDGLMSSLHIMSLSTSTAAVVEKLAGLNPMGWNERVVRWSLLSLGLPSFVRNSGLLKKISASSGTTLFKWMPQSVKEWLIATPNAEFSFDLLGIDYSKGVTMLWSAALIIALNMEVFINAPTELAKIVLSTTFLAPPFVTTLINFIDYISSSLSQRFNRHSYIVLPQEEVSEKTVVSQQLEAESTTEIIGKQTEVIEETVETQELR